MNTHTIQKILNISNFLKKSNFTLSDMFGYFRTISSIFGCFREFSGFVVRFRMYSDTSEKVR